MAKKSPAKVSGKKVAARKAPATRAATRAPATRRPGAVLAPQPEPEPDVVVAPPSRFTGGRLAAEQTFADDVPPAATPLADDPAARARAALRAAAAGLRARDAGARPLTGYEPAERVDPPPPVAAVERPVVTQPPVERPRVTQPPVLAEPATEVLVAPARRRLLAARPAPEPEWTAADQPLDDEPSSDRIPDAMDVLSVPGVASAPPSRTSPRRVPPLARRPATGPPVTGKSPSPPLPSPTPPPPTTEAEPTPPEPPAWTPPAPAPPRVGRGGVGLSVLAIVVSLVVPVVGAIVGIVAATRARRRNLALAGLARIVAVLALVTWLMVGTVVLVAARGSTDYSRLKVGDCFDSSESNEVRGIDVTPCTESHNSEVFFLVTQPSGPADPYPGKDALVQFAADACLGQPLTDYLGGPLEKSSFKDFEIVPQESAWKDGRRVLVCGIDTGGQGRVKGSAKGPAPAG